MCIKPNLKDVRLLPFRIPSSVWNRILTKQKKLAGKPPGSLQGPSLEGNPAATMPLSNRTPCSKPGTSLCPPGGARVGLCAANATAVCFIHTQVTQKIMLRSIPQLQKTQKVKGHQEESTRSIKM